MNSQCNILVYVRKLIQENEKANTKLVNQWCLVTVTLMGNIYSICC